MQMDLKFELKTKLSTQLPMKMTSQTGRVSKESPKLKNNALIVFSSLEKKEKKESFQIHCKDLEKELSLAIETHSISGKKAEVTTLREYNFKNHYRHVLIGGLGSSHFEHENFRQTAASLYENLKNLKIEKAEILFEGLFKDKTQAAELLKAFVEGAFLASYEFSELKSKSTKHKNDKTNKTDKTGKTEVSGLLLSLVSEYSQETQIEKALNEALIIGESVNFSRRLGDLPGNLLTPSLFAETLVKAIKGTAIKASIWDKARIKKERMGGLLGVSQGSDEEPRFIILEYKGSSLKKKKPIVFVGKGLTFDSGGISIKPSAGMEEMKYDMCGGANVVGTLLAIAKMKLKINAVALIPSTENMPGPSATKPGDVHTARNGKTFEVNNTDAEGRLILADALSYGSELDPEVMIDVATLTGAMVISLGSIHTGYFTRDQKLKEKIEEAAKNSGEWIWNLPLTDLHVNDMKGSFADLSNLGPAGKGAGSATAAAFLEQFVEEGIPWAHFDIAGTGWNIGQRVNYCPKKGASGVMIRTLIQLAKQFADR